MRKFETHNPNDSFNHCLAWYIAYIILFLILHDMHWTIGYLFIILIIKSLSLYLYNLLINYFIIKYSPHPSNINVLPDVHWIIGRAAPLQPLIS